MEFPVTIDSQEAFDGLVKERIARVEAKYADYGELKTRADAAESEKTALEKAREKAEARAAEAETKVSGFEAKEQLSSWRAEVAKATGVHADVLRGSSKEELEAHAAVLKPLLTAQEAPVIPNQGDSPNKPAATDAEERAAVRSLFSPGDGD
ncbi:hypothetical protein [Rathayibacter sp. AY2B9]|uniref:hypothetical protein n=1 Tax=Rathayibacter sp. AY2B9 TaxID=2080572 RepID=UPI000CE8BBE6|nr:hypothetical protein [Rathayibacter sp. AY2B9]PPG34518.1 hypothetical protein C5C25_00410 [Rathayibacter sp. AY2B9]